MNQPVDEAFVKALPKVELHAHLSGSISKATLHALWLQKQAASECLGLADPLEALHAMPDTFTFFKIFDQYIYKLINDEQSLRTAVHSVIDDFERDGVVYLELRTTPRLIPEAGIDKRRYVDIVLSAIRERCRDGAASSIGVHLLLSIDRKMSLEEATEVLTIATVHQQQFQQDNHSIHGNSPLVLGIDLCGNPMTGNIGIFTPVIEQAKQQGLRVTIHFAEVPESSTDLELRTILGWRPDRLGHVINVPNDIKTLIIEQDIALELCLSCNIIARMVTGDFSNHHFGYWLQTSNRIALSTDDVGVFESPLSNEYLLAAKHFDLTRPQLISLCRRSADTAFKGQARILALLDVFEAATV